MDSIKKMKIDSVVKYIFMTLAMICASSIILIVLFIFIKGVQPFINEYKTDNGVYTQNVWDFLIGTTWASNLYGVLGIAINTIYIVSIAALLSLVISILTALFIVRIAPKKLSICMKSVIELLAAIPSIVFGLFGQGYICPLIRDFAESIGIQTMGGVSVIATIIVLTIMMIPTITTISITSMEAIKQDQIQASLALGATKAQTDFKIVLKGAKSGIFAALILGIGRALGEATAVSMVCGDVIEGPVFNLFEPTRTLTSTMIGSIHESSGIDYDIRFSVGIVLIAIILVANVGLNALKRRMERI
ncbi:MAG: phosphate ABC transporter permease subunit PstC [Acholeplasmatales bacterium]|nr:phosphate ABC transporter permease subunit PstC [Acholeplasmatales bacterium]